jgi:hypothetical protein
MKMSLRAAMIVKGDDELKKHGGELRKGLTRICEGIEIFNTKNPIPAF